MNKDEIIKSDRHKLMDLLYDLKQGELCTPECYGCCGDNERSFAYCPDAVKNFEKGLAELGYRKVADDEFVLKQDEVWEFRKDHAEVKFLKDKIKQETAKELLQELKEMFGTSREFRWSDKGTAWETGSIGNPIRDKLERVAKKYGIELEEKNND